MAESSLQPNIEGNYLMVQLEKAGYGSLDEIPLNKARIIFYNEKRLIVEGSGKLTPFARSNFFLTMPYEIHEKRVNLIEIVSLRKYWHGFPETDLSTAEANKITLAYLQNHRLELITLNSVDTAFFDKSKKTSIRPGRESLVNIICAAGVVYRNLREPHT